MLKMQTQAVTKQSCWMKVDHVDDDAHASKHLLGNC